MPRWSVKCLLEAEGDLVCEAADVASGLLLLLKEQPDIASVDIGLPRIDGYEVARQVRKHSGKRLTKIYALTGYGRPEDEAAAIQAVSTGT